MRLDRLLEIFKEASDLAHEMRLSPQPYAFDIAFRYSASNRNRFLFDGEIDKYRIINTATCQPLRDDDLVTAARDGRFGQKLCVVHPALVRRSGIEQGDTILTKATILVSLDLPCWPPRADQYTDERLNEGRTLEWVSRHHGHVLRCVWWLESMRSWP